MALYHFGAAYVIMLLVNGLVTTPRLQEVRATPLVTQRTPAWFKMRGDRITGSIVDTILGTNPYEGAASVVAQKAGTETHFRGNAFTAHGTKFEPIAIQTYLAKTGRTHVELGLVSHSTRSDLAHSPDGIVLHPIDPPRLLEVKCPVTRKIIPGQVPSQYQHQIQLGLEIFDLEEADFVQFKPETNGQPAVLDIVTIKREPGWLTRHSHKFSAFWRAVQAYRQHVSPILEELKKVQPFNLE